MTIDFDRELAAGPGAYDGAVGRWWHQRATDAAHARAYRTVIRELRSVRRQPPRVILDYACGSGLLLTRLYRQFPRARLIGVDGSALMLSLARQRLGRMDPSWRTRVRLIETALPDFSLPRGIADVVILAFPNLVYPPDGPRSADRDRHRSAHERAVAETLATARGPEADDDEEEEDPEGFRDSLLSGRIVARNLRRLVRRAGTCVRVEYTDAELERHPVTHLRSAFEEGSLGDPVVDRRVERFFRLIRSGYFRSTVVLDVYDQTRDPTDKIGGYSVRILEAI